MTNTVVFPTGDGADAGFQRIVRYVPYRQLWESFDRRVSDVIKASGARQVGELGGGANPTVSLFDSVGHPIELTILDISSTEMERAPDSVRKRVVDLCAEKPPLENEFDLVFSRMLCEHVTLGSVFHRNCFTALRPGGHAVHFFPTATAAPFLVNRLLPESLGVELLERLVPSRRRGGRNGKFPAHYSWCWGPTRRQIKRYEAIGFEVVSYEAGVGHDYYAPIPVLRELERLKAEFILRHPSPWLAAYALVILRRPVLS